MIIFPHVGASATSIVNGMPMTGKDPLPYKKTDATPNLAYLDSSDDIRGGMGLAGLLELAKFVQEGGTLIVDGSNTTIFPDYGLTSGVTVEHPAQLFVRGSILRAKIADAKSPIAYGFEGTDLPVYFNQDPVLNASGGGFGGAEVAWERFLAEAGRSMAVKAKILRPTPCPSACHLGMKTKPHLRNAISAQQMTMWPRCANKRGNSVLRWTNRIRAW